MATRDTIAQKSGTAVSLRGRYMNEEEKRNVSDTSDPENKPLFLMIQANVAAKVQVAIHKISEVCRNYEANGPNNTNNYGLSEDAPTTVSCIFYKVNKVIN